MVSNYVKNLQKTMTEIAKERDAVYIERNNLVSFVSKIFPSYRGLHESTDLSWHKDWINIIYVETPKGQLSWHIHKKLLPLFEHLELREGKNWDGHTTEEKYRRLSCLGLSDVIEELPDMANMVNDDLNGR